MLITPMPAPTNAIFAPESRSLTCFSSNLQNPLASNLQVSFSRTVPVLAAILVALCVMPAASASPLDPNTDLPGPVRYAPAQLSGHAPRTAAMNSDRTFERYGPQATERAVRSSLKTALMPDPVAMAALIFCAFALRWMRMRRQSLARAHEVANRAPVLARVA